MFNSNIYHIYKLSPWLCLMYENMLIMSIGYTLIRWGIQPRTYSAATSVSHMNISVTIYISQKLENHVLFFYLSLAFQYCGQCEMLKMKLLGIRKICQLRFSIEIFHLEDIHLWISGHKIKYSLLYNLQVNVLFGFLG